MKTFSGGKYMKKRYKVLLGLHIFVGLGAMVGGLACIISPDAPFGAPTSMLVNSPFDNFLIPGIILLVVIGLGNIISALLFRFKLKYQAYFSNVVSWALVIWIVVQCIMIQAVVLPHYIFFVIGLVQGIISLMMLFEEKLFPANIVLKIIKPSNN